MIWEVIIIKYFDLIFLLVFYNIIPMWTELNIHIAVKIAGTIILSMLFIIDLIRSEPTPVKGFVKGFRLRSLRRGTSLIWISAASLIPETAIIVMYFCFSDAGTLTKIFSIVMPVLAIILTFLAGFVRTVIGAKQIKIVDYVFLLIFWWVPVINLVLIWRFYRKAKREYIFEADKAETENVRAENEICKTKYPIVMVHGIFFRDWQLMNYWGRVPATLTRNGASVYYGNQQSALSIPDSAAELREKILRIIHESGAEKVNIIAHSKGGLDARYAISTLGLDEYVATLTTINTPHKGCEMASYLLKKVPDGLAAWIAKRYNSMFGILGDKAPDFMAGVRDLCPESVAELESCMEDSPNVSYRSCMSVMKNAFSAGFPLNAGYLLMKKLNGPNDGLVWTGSAAHGRFRLIQAKKRRGISHGDMIDLFRENIDGFDVREFYAGIVAELKNEGY